ncbi:MAG: hypothetical protein D6790_21905 [Caldilineae bacterium]|nr:MAG: hypothetical protein D6790_21905 [Caldilineae bacterium]
MFDFIAFSAILFDSFWEILPLATLVAILFEQIKDRFSLSVTGLLFFLASMTSLTDSCCPFLVYIVSIQTSSWTIIWDVLVAFLISSMRCLSAVGMIFVFRMPYIVIFLL